MNKQLETVFSEVRRHEWIVPAALVLFLLAQMLCSVREMSQHADESTHLYAGYRILKCGDYAYGREHPPLAKVLAAIPLAAKDAPLDCTAPPLASEEAEDAVVWLYSQPNWWQLLSAARIAAGLSAVLLLIGVWVTARKLFGITAAALATALIAFEPNVLGHGALVLTDTLSSALFLLTVFAFYSWTQRRTPLLLLASGAMLGLALLSKNSAPMLVFILAGIAAVEAWLAPDADAPQRPRRFLHNLAALLPVILLAAVVIWAGYGFHATEGERRASDNAAAALEAPGAQISASVQVFRGLRSLHALPPAYLDGLIDAHELVKSRDAGVDLLGKHYIHGPWFATPLTLGVKLTLGFWGILLLGAAGLTRRGRQDASAVVALLLPVLFYLALSLLVSRSGGIRYLLPLLPLVAILAASGAVFMAQRYRWAQTAVWVLLAAHAVSSLACYPNYLSYANEAWGGPGNLYRVMPSDNAQAYWQVAQYLRKSPNTPCWILSEFFVRPAAYGVNCETFGLFTAKNIPARMDGIVVVSSVNLFHYAQPGELLSGFQKAQLVARLGGSAVLAFRGSFDTTSVVAQGLEARSLGFQRQGRLEEALVAAAQAVELAPDSAFAHGFLGGTLMMNQRPLEAMAECRKARAIALADENQSEVLALAERLMRQISGEFGVPLPPGVPPVAPAQ